MIFVRRAIYDLSKPSFLYNYDFFIALIDKIKIQTNLIIIIKTQ